MKPMIGIAMAVWAPFLSTTAPIMGGKTIPPEMAATRRAPPSFVCLPRPRRPNVKIVAKHADSKHKTVISMAIETFPAVFMAVIANIMHKLRYTESTTRGLIAGIIIANAATKRLIA